MKHGVGGRDQGIEPRKKVEPVATCDCLLCNVGLKVYLFRL
jgi:hypothetical protein